MPFTPPGEARAHGMTHNESLHLRHGEGFQMTAAQFELIGPSAAEELLRARFHALAEWGCPVEHALVIAGHVEVDIFDAVSLLRHGCPADLLIPILS